MTYFNVRNQRCMPVREQCGVGEYISRMELADSDRQCATCPSCEAGFYRDPSDCVSNRYHLVGVLSVMCTGCIHARNHSVGLANTHTHTHTHRYRESGLPAKCIACAPCPRGTYIDATKCESSGTVSGASAGCIACGKCADMQNIAGVYCTGKQTQNTQRCQTCSSSCPAGMYILPGVERCSGKTMVSNEEESTRPFDPATECAACTCSRGGNVRVSGCNGKTRWDDSECVACSACPVGQYISGGCIIRADQTGTGLQQFTPPICQECPMCERGKYLAQPCSGKQMGYADQVWK